MKKLKKMLIAFVLVFALLFVTACGPVATVEQIDKKTTLNTSGTYQEEGALEGLNTLLESETFGDSVKSGYKLSFNINLFMEMDYTMIVKLTNEGEIDQIACKMVVTIPDFEDEGESEEIEVKMYLKDGKIYVSAPDEDGGVTKVYASIEDMPEYSSYLNMNSNFDFESLLTNLQLALDSDAVVKVYEEGTTIKYQIKYSVQEEITEEEYGEDASSLALSGDIEIYIVLEDGVFAGYSMNQIVGEKSTPIATLVKFDEEIVFPDFSGYVAMQDFEEI